MRNKPVKTSLHEAYLIVVYHAGDEIPDDGGAKTDWTLWGGGIMTLLDLVEKSMHACLFV